MSNVVLYSKFAQKRGIAGTIEWCDIKGKSGTGIYRSQKAFDLAVKNFSSMKRRKILTRCVFNAFS